MLSTVLPIRASDFARPVLLSRRTCHRISGALGTILIERVLDLTSILLMFVAFAALRWNEFSHDADIARWFYIVRAGAIASAVILTSCGSSSSVSVSFMRPAAACLARWDACCPAACATRGCTCSIHSRRPCAITNNRSALVKVLFCTAGTWMCLTSQFWLATLAVDHPLPYDTSFFVTGVTTVGLAIPTPGGIGGFHKACQLVLTRFYGFSVDSSVAVAVLFHIIGTLPVLVTGLFLFAKEGVSLKQLAASKEEGDSSAEGTSER